jgi:hypothetical protein
MGGRTILRRERTISQFWEKGDEDESTNVRVLKPLSQNWERGLG